MDDNRKRRQNDPSQYSSSDPRYSQDHGQGRGFAAGSADRFRAAAAPPPITTSPSAGRGIGGSHSGYSYYAEAAPFPTALPPNPMPYQAEYGSEQRQQGFTSYNNPMMYAVNQSGPQGTVYDAAQHFQQRQTPAMQLVPDVAAPYYAGDSSNAASTPLLHHQQSSSSSTAFHQSPVDRNPLLQGYSGSMAGMSGMTQGSAEVMEEEEYSSTGLDEAYNSYQNALKEIFQNIRNGMLIEASSSLVEVSDWLLAHVGDLGLTVDDENLHGDRIKLWNEFNTAWLAVLQKQKDLTLEYIHHGTPPRHPQSLISYDFLNKMAKELIRHCDNIEKNGLVDYQCGVWEERIITILTECVDLLENNEEGGSGAGPAPRTNPSLGIGRAPP